MVILRFGFRKQTDFLFSPFIRRQVVDLGSFSRSNDATSTVKRPVNKLSSFSFSSPWPKPSTDPRETVLGTSGNYQIDRREHSSSWKFHLEKSHGSPFPGRVQKKDRGIWLGSTGDVPKTDKGLKKVRSLFPLR